MRFENRGDGEAYTRPAEQRRGPRPSRDFAVSASEQTDTRDRPAPAHTPNSQGYVNAFLCCCRRKGLLQNSEEIGPELEGRSELHGMQPGPSTDGKPE